MDEVCELCGAKSEMDFNAIVAVSETEVAHIQGSICFNCFGKHPDDMALAIALIEKRLEEAVQEMNREETIILTCPDCGCEFEMPLWMYEIDIEEEGEGYQPSCPSCSGMEGIEY